MLGAAARRLQRPELLAAFYPGARQLMHEEIALRSLLAGALGADSVYVDVGANRGQVLRHALRVAPQGNHIAFEPIPELASALRREFPGVDCRQLAVGKEATTSQFCHFRTMDGWSGLQRSPEISDELGDPEFISVQVSTLDAELQGLSPSVLKIDVEGAELDVLEGARELLARARPLVIFEHVSAAAQLYDAPPQAPWDLLGELGYRIYSVTGDGPFTRSAFAENTLVVNWLATPGSREGSR